MHWILLYQKELNFWHLISLLVNIYRSVSSWVHPVTRRKVHLQLNSSCSDIPDERIYTCLSRWHNFLSEQQLNLRRLSHNLWGAEKLLFNWWAAGCALTLEIRERQCYSDLPPPALGPHLENLSQVRGGARQPTLLIQTDAIRQTDIEFLKHFNAF